MKFILKNGATIEVESVNEYLSQDRTFTVLGVHAKNPGTDLQGLFKILSIPDNLSVIKTVTKDNVTENYTGYGTALDVSKRSSDFGIEYDIRIVPAGKTQV